MKKQLPSEGALLEMSRDILTPMGISLRYLARKIMDDTAEVLYTDGHLLYIWQYAQYHWRLWTEASTGVRTLIDAGYIQGGIEHD